MSNNTNNNLSEASKTNTLNNKQKPSRNYIKSFRKMNCYKDILSIYPTITLGSKCCLGFPPEPSMEKLRIALGVVNKIRPIAINAKKNNTGIHLISWDWETGHLAAVICAFMFTNVVVTCVSHFHMLFLKDIKRVRRIEANIDCINQEVSNKIYENDYGYHNIVIATHTDAITLLSSMGSPNKQPVSGFVILPKEFIKSESVKMRGEKQRKEFCTAIDVLFFLRKIYTDNHWVGYLYKDVKIGHPINTFVIFGDSRILTL